MDSPDWINNKKARINPVNDEYKCLHYAEIVALNHKDVGKNSQRLSRLKTKYICKIINLNNGKKFQKNNTIALHILYVKIIKIYSAYMSKQSSNHKKRSRSLMVTNGEITHFQSCSENLSPLLTLFRMDLLGAAPGWGCEKRPACLKSVTHH